ncbi:MAG: HNH endonuclease [Vampirovibrionales bacterium]
MAPPKPPKYALASDVLKEHLALACCLLDESSRATESAEAFVVRACKVNRDLTLKWFDKIETNNFDKASIEEIKELKKYIKPINKGGQNIIKHFNWADRSAEKKGDMNDYGQNNPLREDTDRSRIEIRQMKNQINVANPANNFRREDMDKAGFIKAFFIGHYVWPLGEEYKGEDTATLREKFDLSSNGSEYLATKESIVQDEPLKEEGSTQAKVPGQQEVVRRLEDLIKNSDDPHKKEHWVEVYARDTDLVKQAKEHFKYKCFIPECGNTFIKPDGTPYIEVHHIIPLHQGGEDKLENLSLLCAHHHRMVHFATEEERQNMTAQLQKRVSV